MKRIKWWKHTSYAGKVAGSAVGSLAILLLVLSLRGQFDLWLVLLFVPAFLIGEFVCSQVEYFTLEAFLDQERRIKYGKREKNE